MRTTKEVFKIVLDRLTLYNPEQQFSKELTGKFVLAYDEKSFCFGICAFLNFMYEDRLISKVERDKVKNIIKIASLTHGNMVGFLFPSGELESRKNWLIEVIEILEE